MVSRIRQISDGQILENGLTNSTILAELEALRFDGKKPPPRPKPMWKLSGFGIATPGNLVGIQAQPKAGKSAFIGGMLAAFLQQGSEHLGVTCSAGPDQTVLHFDCEQAPHDHHESMECVLSRAGVPEMPKRVA